VKFLSRHSRESRDDGGEGIDDRETTRSKDRGST
jgi:hypothetical protein